MKAYVWYGTHKYEIGLDDVVYAKYMDFVREAKKCLSKKSGGYPLATADTEVMFIAGDGWSVEMSWK